MSNGDKSLFMLILSCICFWLVLDQVFGNKLLTQFVQNILPNSSKNSVESSTVYDEKKGGVQLGEKTDKDGNSVNLIGDKTHFCKVLKIQRRGTEEECPYCNPKNQSAPIVTPGSHGSMQ